MRSLLTRSDYEIAMAHHPMLRAITMVARALEWPREVGVVGPGGEATEQGPYDATLTVHEHGFTFSGAWRSEASSIRFFVELRTVGLEGTREIKAEINVAATGALTRDRANVFAIDVEAAARRLSAADILLRSAFAYVAQDKLVEHARKGFDAWKAVAELAAETGD